MYRREWWIHDPNVVVCDLCGCPVQRLPNGNVAQGLAMHKELIHPKPRPVLSGSS